MRPIYSTVFWLFFGSSSIALFPVAVLIWLVTAPFDPRRRALHQFTCFWASLYTWLNPAWPVQIEGRDKIRPDETYVMVSNHLSFLDILVFFSVLMVGFAYVWRRGDLDWVRAVSREPASEIRRQTPAVVEKEPVLSA